MPFNTQIPARGTNPYFIPFKAWADAIASFVNGLETSGGLAITGLTISSGVMQATLQNGMTVPIGSVGGPIPADPVLDHTYTMTADAFTGMDGTLAAGWSSARGPYSVAIGWRAAADGENSIAIGSWTGAEASGTDSVAIGPASKAYGTKSVAIGQDASALGQRSVQIGSGPKPWGADNTSINGYGYNGNAPAIIRHEEAQIGARDLHIRRPIGVDPFGDYPTGPETGIILEDSSGGKWRIKVSTSGTISATAYTEPTTIPWTALTSAGNREWAAISSSTNGAILVAAAGINTAGNLYRSTDSGATWTALTAAGSRKWADVITSADGSKIAAITSDTKILLVSSNGGTSFTTPTIPSTSTQTINLAGDSTLAKIVLGRGGKVYTSTNLGTTWSSPIDVSDTDIWNTPVSISGNGSVIYANGYMNGVNGFRISKDGGTTWGVFRAWARGSYDEPRNNGWLYVGMSTDGSDMVGSDSFGGTWVSGDTGDSWGVTGGYAPPPSARWDHISVASNGYQAIIADTYQSGVYLSYDVNTSWQYVNMSAGKVWTATHITPDASRAFVAFGYIYAYTL